MATRRTGWPRGHTQWLLGTVLLFAVGALLGWYVLGGLWIGLVLAAALSIGWLIAYESWRGRTPDLADGEDDGARI